MIKHVERYIKLKSALTDFGQNIDEKMCEIIGFYAWFNGKHLNSSKHGAKTLKNYCTFYSTLLFLREIVPVLLPASKKSDKTKVQLDECEGQIAKTITMTPFMMVEDKISQLYESKISTRTQVPTSETQRIVDILKISTDCLKEYFPIECEQKIN